MTQQGFLPCLFLSLLQGSLGHELAGKGLPSWMVSAGRTGFLQGPRATGRRRGHLLPICILGWGASGAPCCREEGPGRTPEAGRSWAGWWSGGPGQYGDWGPEWEGELGVLPLLWVPVAAVTTATVWVAKTTEVFLTVRQGRAPPEALGQVTFWPLSSSGCIPAVSLHLQHGLPCIFSSVSCKDT